MLLSIIISPKFRSYSFSFFFFKENIQKGKNLISFSLGQTFFFYVQECSSHNLKSLSVQNHLYTVLYYNAVVLFPSLVIDDTQGLTFSVRQYLGREHTHFCHRGWILFDLVFFFFPWVEFPKSKRDKYHFHFHHHNCKMQNYREKRGEETN